MKRVHLGEGIDHAGYTQNRELPPHQAQGLNRRAAQQQSHAGVAPAQAIDHVIGLVRNIAHAITITVPAEVIPPVVAILV